jgi:hypothetical protein
MLSFAVQSPARSLRLRERELRMAREAVTEMQSDEVKKPIDEDEKLADEADTDDEGLLSDDEKLDEAGEESFPASDPPAF